MQPADFRTIDCVRNEIIRRKDERAGWIKRDGAVLFGDAITADESDAVTAAYEQVRALVNATARDQDIYCARVIAFVFGRTPSS